MHKMTPFQRYVVFVGGRKVAAERLGVSRPLVEHMWNGIRGISVPVAKKIAEQTHGQIALHELRPDVWEVAA